LNRIAPALAVLVLAYCPPLALAQAYPVKPIRLITAEAGGGNDFTARAIVRGIGDSLGQQLIVDNRGGAGGIIAAEIAARAAPDGYTLLVYAGNLWTIPLLKKNVPYDMARDFAPVTWAARSPSTLVVHPALPVKSVRDLIALARSRPGQLNYGSGGSGSSTHLAAELFKSMARVNIVRVTYRGNAPAMNDLIAGQIQMMIATAGTVAPHAGSGRLRALAVTSTEPTPLAPGLPTVASAGLPGYESLSIYGLFAPAKVSNTIIQQLNREVVKALARADIKELFLNAGLETVGSTPEAFAAAIKADTARLSKVIAEAGIREE
jgi:tripartite-type tricarboxylate transporter receptor subunit TctC